MESGIKERIREQAEESAMLWEYFYQISQIPRATFNSQRISQYIKDQARLLDLDFKEDAIGNICVKVPASKGFETCPSLTFQAHTDMVCEKNLSTQHNFEKDPIKWKIKGERLYAEETTLGADNGIGVATLLALMADKNLEHPSLECLFTVDEEVGLIGANKIDPSLFESHYLINLDNEEEGVFCIGCAGGINSLISKSDLNFTPKQAGYLTKITVSGLDGGHSGGEIHKGLGNANSIIIKALHCLSENFLHFSLVSLQGGNKSNAIPRESQAILWSEDLLEIEDLIFELNQTFKCTLKKGQDLGFRLYYSEEPLGKTSVKVLDEKCTKELIDLFSFIPHGVQKMYNENLVGTSLNFASICVKDEEGAKIVLSHRSLWKEALKPEVLYKELQESFFRLGFKWELSEGYLPWEPKNTSALADYCAKVWDQIYSSTKAKKLVIHAGLECGIIGAVASQKQGRSLDMISFGPNIRQPHTPHDLSVTVSKDSIKEVYEKTLQEYALKVKIDGFRPGKVPVSIIKKRYKSSLESQTLEKVINQAFQQALEQTVYKPLRYQSPSIEGLEAYQEGEDLSFTASYDVFPHLDLLDYQDLQVDVPCVQISEEDLEEELKKVQERYASLIERSEDSSCEIGDVLLADFCELDENGEEIESTKRQDFTFTLGKSENIYNFDKEIEGMKKQETKVFEKTLSVKQDTKEETKTVKLKVLLKRIQKKDLPELSDELAQDINEKFTNLEDLKLAIRDELQKQLELHLKEYTVNAILDKLVHKYPFDVPASLIDWQLEQNWKYMLQQSGMNEHSFEELMGKAQERIKESWKPTVILSLKRQIVMQNLLEKAKIELTQEDLNQEYERQAASYKVSVEEIKNYFSSPNLSERMSYDLRLEKVKMQVLQSIKINKTEEQSFSTFMKNAV
ncbi:UNVERIFIED_CONTAM: hypothetical protein PYX00_011221 [Menopon gallinae]|uniref:peptidylprolyl isomerase n=1 Tax=Menopon gallinae TaxID=328185 RepID=A0AAW2H6V5_9NEOP